MIVNSYIIDQLEEFKRLTEKNKSSHWKTRLKNDNYSSSIYLNLGFGSFEKKTYIKSIFHYIFLRFLFGFKIFKSQEAVAYKNIFEKMNRQLDLDALRHIFTFNKLKYKNHPKKICIIGDGKANFVLGCLKIFPETPIYSINLTEVLIHDYLIISKHNFIKDSETQVVSNRNDLKNTNKKLFLIPSSNKNLLYDSEIELFVNIASFQEMTFEEINSYFKIIKSNNAKLYACNREKKILSGGEVLKFDDYPWGKGVKIFQENCPWHQKYYSFRPNFIHKYDGNIMHCLIDYSVKN